MLEQLKEQKEEIFAKLNAVLSKLSVIHSQKLDVSSVLDKLKSAITHLNENRFLIVMFGAFSDGKSSVVASFTEREDIDDIRIEPSTNQISPYDFGQDAEHYLMIVDTPGLFSEYSAHTETSKRFISEADLVIYIVDPVNPLKDSHREELRWIALQIGKKDALIFVVNKMDLIADLEDHDDFEQHASIKRKVVQDTVVKFTELSGFRPEVVCVSADPDGRGMKYWFAHKQEYERLSRMKQLRSLIERYIQQNKFKLIHKMGISVLKESLQTIIKQVEAQRNQVQEAIRVKEFSLAENMDNKQMMDKDISKHISNIKEELRTLREETLLTIMNTKDIQDLRKKVLVKIGNDSEVLIDRIEQVFQENLDSLFVVKDQFSKKLLSSASFLEKINADMVTKFATHGVKFSEYLLKNSDKIISMLSKIPKFAKPELWVKFGAKLLEKTGKFAKFLKFLPIITEILDGIIDLILENKFKKQREELCDQLAQMFKEINELLTETQFRSDFLPEYSSLIEMLELMEADLKDSRNLDVEYQTLVQELEFELSNLEL